ncbi:MAG: hypothetical protein AB7I19_08395 [Planctomycetota bacterium]
MARSAYQVQAEARRVFARHWVDLDRLRFGIYRDTLRATGELHAIGDAARSGSLPLIEALTAELLRVPEIRHVALQFDNWERGGDGRWREVSARPLAVGNPSFPEPDVADRASPNDQHD